MALVTVDSLSETYYNDNAILDCSDDTEAVAQSFTGTAYTLSSCKFYIEKQSSSPPGSVYAKLYAHTGVYGTSSKPTGSALATSSAIAASSMPSSYALVTFNFPTGYLMSAGTKYCISVEYADGDPDVNYLHVGINYGENPHSGNEAYKSSGTWNAWNEADVIFYVYGISAMKKVVGETNYDIKSIAGTTNATAKKIAGVLGV